MLNAALIKRFAPSARADIVDGLVTGWPAIYAAGITKPNRLQHFMAEMAVESAGLTRLEENLSYSAARAHQVFPNRFPTVASAQPYAHDPQAFANKVYGGRLGNTQPNDGWFYRGGGLIQTTGRDNYKAAGFQTNPDDLRHMPGALTSALSYWTRRGINALVDKGNIVIVRQAVNGGTNGLDDLRLYLAHAVSIFVKIVPPAPPTTVAAGKVA